MCAYTYKFKFKYSLFEHTVPVGTRTPYGVFLCECAYNKYFALKNSWGYRPNSNCLLSSFASQDTTTCSEANIIILSTVRSMPSSDFDPEQLRGDRSWSMEHLGFVTNPHQICVGITRSRFGLIVVSECDAWPVCTASCLVWSFSRQYRSR